MELLRPIRVPDYLSSGKQTYWFKEMLMLDLYGDIKKLKTKNSCLCVFDMGHWGSLNGEIQEAYTYWVVNDIMMR